MRLSQIVTHKLCLTLNVVATDSQLAIEIHDRLLELNYLTSSCCKRFSESCACGIAFNQFRLACKLPRGVVNERVAEALLRAVAVEKLKLGDRVSVQLDDGLILPHGALVGIDIESQTAHVYWAETQLLKGCSFVDLLPAHP